MTSERIILAAALSGALAVILGAFGAHSLKPLLTESQLSGYQTAVLYQFIHTLALLVIGLTSKNSVAKGHAWAARCFGIGIACFSGSLYLLTTQDVLGISIPKLFGLVTPLGGLFFIGGWLALAFLERRPHETTSQTD